MELTDHLAELRTRIIRSIWYLILGAIVAYQFFAPMYGFLYNPLEKEINRLNHERMAKAAVEQAKSAGPGADAFPVLKPIVPNRAPTRDEYNQLVAAIDWIHLHPVNAPLSDAVFRGFYEPFTVRLKVSIIVGFLLVMPLILWEFGLFVLPALTPEERKPLRMLIPLSVFLLIFGITVAYFTMFFAMRWFLSYLSDYPTGAALMQDPSDYFLFFVKMMAAFGIAFQLPVVLMGGAFVGVITSKGLIKHWRWGVVVAALGGLFTPSNDLISMALMSIPLLILYFGSIILVRFVEFIRARDKARTAGRA